MLCPLSEYYLSVRLTDGQSQVKVFESLPPALFVLCPGQWYNGIRVVVVTSPNIFTMTPGRTQLTSLGSPDRLATGGN